MPFVKGNKLGSLQKGTKKARTQAWDNIVGWLIGDGGHEFKKKLAKLASGEELTKAEREFMDHYKDLIEFHQPKLARTEINGEMKHKFLDIYDET